MGAGEPGERSKEFLLAEYRYFTDSLWRNEEGGEKRVQFFITLVTAVLAGLVAVAKPQGGEVRAEAIYPMAAGALAALLVIGYVTLRLTVLHAVVGGLAFVMAGRVQMWKLGRS